IVKFNQGVDEKVKQQAVEDILALKNKIPEIKKISAGVNFTDRSKGYDHGWVVELEKKEGLGVYNEHPEHLAYVTKYRPLFADLIAVDYES
ncbi:hypothetical protein DFQ30_003568, partial [Apophysomyces sp. BC1015]